MVFENDTQNLSQEEAERMFERFYTTDASRSQGGTGVGLTIAKYLAEAMGGSMEAGVKNKDGANWLVIRTCLQSGRGEQDSE